MVSTVLLSAIVLLSQFGYPQEDLQSTRSMDCKALANALPGKVHFPGSIQYTTSENSYFAAFENELSPTCIVRPQSAADVSTIIKRVGSPSFGGRVQLAIRGGGHTPWAGAANIDNGVTMDLQGLTGVNVNARTKIASLGAGERWSSVYEQLGAQGLAVAGGRVSKVGVGGLITGGTSYLNTSCR